MDSRYVVHNQKAIHFVTFTLNQWVDVFTRKLYKDILVESLRYCQKEKGLEIYAYVIMSNHLHLIICAREGNLSDIIRDFKKYTAKKLFKEIRNNPIESRKTWILWALTKEDSIWFWKAGYHGIELDNEEIFNSKLDYIHQNPVKAGLVLEPEHYFYSSCGDYYGIRKGPIEVITN